ncbi:MAG: ribonuclease P protein component [Lachnospiraceae bacterium]|nr:ribonuclease P protein component [Lachnospiraceae bacterium]
MRKYESLKSSIDFKSVYDKHKSKADKYLVMYILKNKLDHNRLGISVSKKVGNSVVRHRLARLVRESMRLHQDEFNSGLDIVVVVRASANPKKNSNNAENARPLKCSDVERSLLHLASQHKILSD